MGRKTHGGKPPPAPLRTIVPTMAPTGRTVIKRLFADSTGPGTAKGSVKREYQLGQREDRMDFNPQFCMARVRKTLTQCGQFKLRGQATCGIHGAGYKVRQAGGKKLTPQQAGAVSGMARRIKRDGAGVTLDRIADALPELRKRILAVRSSAIDALDLDEDVIHLTALRDAIVAGEVELEGVLLVRALTAVIDSKANTVRTKAALEAKNMVPLDLMRSYVRRFVALIARFVPADRQAELLRELRLVALNAEAEVGTG